MTHLNASESRSITGSARFQMGMDRQVRESQVEDARREAVVLAVAFDVGEGLQRQQEAPRPGARVRPLAPRPQREFARARRR